MAPSRKAFVSILLILALAAPGFAQGETLTTRALVGVYSWWQTIVGRRTDFQSVPANTSIAMGSWELVTGSSGGPPTRCAIARSPGALTLDESGMYLGGTTGGHTVGSLPPEVMGPHQFLYHIAGAGSGNVVIEVTGVRMFAGSIAVDVLDDNVPELSETFSLVPKTSPRLVVVPVRFTRGLPIAIATAHGHDRGYVSSYRISVRLERGSAAVITSYGTPCNASLTGLDTFAAGQHRLDFLVRGQPSSLIAVLFGVNPVQIPIFGTNCDQLTDLVNFAILPANALGEASFGFTLPAPLQADVRMQALSWTPVPILTASAGLRVVVAD